MVFAQPRACRSVRCNMPWVFALLGLVLFAAVALPPSETDTLMSTTTSSLARMAQAPLQFVPNVGQLDPHVRFHASNPAGTLLFTPSEVGAIAATRGISHEAYGRR